MSLTEKIKTSMNFLLGRQTARDATVITMLLTIVSRVLGYIRVLLVAYFFGASAFVDAYYVVFGAINFLTGTIQGTVESAVVPKLMQNEKETARDLFGWTIRTLFIGCIIVSAIILIFPEYFIRIFAATFDNERITYAASMVKWILPGSTALLGIGIFSLWANYNGRFSVSNTVLVFSNIIGIPTLLILYPVMKNYALPAFQSIVFVILFFCMWYVIKDVPLFPKKPVSKGLLSKTGGDALLCLVSSGAGFLYTIVDRYFASSLPVGNVSAISYAQLIFSQPIGLMGAAMSIYLVKASQIANAKEESENQIFTALYMAWSYFFPAAILLSVLSGPIVKILLGYGAFDVTAVSLTTPCLAVTALGLPILICLTIMGRYAQALGRLRLLAVWSYIGIIGNFFLDWLFVKPYGAPGLCAATTIMWTVSTVFFMLMMTPKILWKLCRSVFLQTVIVVVWAVPLYFLSFTGTFLALSAGAIVGAAHMIICELTGVFNPIPIEWRPMAIIKIIGIKIKTK